MQSFGQSAEGAVFYYVKWRNYALVVLSLPLLLLIYGISALLIWTAPDILADTYRDEGVSGLVWDCAVGAMIVVVALCFTMMVYQIFRRVRSKLPAFIVDHDGVEGFGQLIRKRFKWAEIGRVYGHNHAIRIVRRSEQRLPFLVRALIFDLDEDRIDAPLYLIETQGEDLAHVMLEYAPQGWREQLDDT